MKFKVVVDRLGVSLFPEDVELAYDKAGDVYYDIKCRHRGIENLFDLADDLGLIERDADHKYIRKIETIEIIRH